MVDRLIVEWAPADGQPKLFWKVGAAEKALAVTVPGLKPLPRRAQLVEPEPAVAVGVEEVEQRTSRLGKRQGRLVGEKAGVQVEEGV